MSAESTERKTRAELRAMVNAGTLGPWAEDDCNVFSEPLRASRHAAIQHRAHVDRSAPHPDEGLSQPYGWVATTGQATDVSDSDATLIVAMRNVFLDLLGALDSAEEALHEVCEAHVLNHVTRARLARALQDIRKVAPRE